MNLRELKDELVQMINSKADYNADYSEPGLREAAGIVKEFFERYQAKDVYIHNGWIPCSERLPENWQEVLHHPRSSYTGVAKYYGGVWYDGYHSNGLPFEVTHWQHIPKPPTK